MRSVILNFHGVGPIPRPIDDGERDCWLHQDAFEAVLDLVRGLSHVRLTVDDGNASDFEFILPALLRRGLQATFFVCSGRLDQPAFLSRSHLRELLAHGMGVGCHGSSHHSWRHLSPDQLREEIIGSRQVLERVSGKTVDEAACPFGAYDRTVLRALRQAGYRRVYTSDGGTANPHHWLQARTTVTRSMSLQDVERLVQQGSGAWQKCLIGARKLVKRLR